MESILTRGKTKDVPGVYCGRLACAGCLEGADTSCVIFPRQVGDALVVGSRREVTLKKSLKSAERQWPVKKSRVGGLFSLALLQAVAKGLSKTQRLHCVPPSFFSFFLSFFLFWFLVFVFQPMFEISSHRQRPGAFTSIYDL